MKSKQIVASSVAALSMFVTSASAWAAESEVKSEETRRHDRKAVPAGEAVSSIRDTNRCREFCQLSEIPVYVPPSRGSVAHRVGGGTRGGDSHS
jgi:hypothetical protein